MIYLMLITSILSLLLTTMIVSQGSIFYAQKIKSFLFSNFFMLMFKHNFLQKLKFFDLIMGNTHLIYSKTSCEQMTFYLKSLVLLLSNKMG